MNNDTLLRLPEVETRVGLKQAMIYRLIGENRFPAPVKLGNKSRWSSHEISDWIEARKRERNMGQNVGQAA